MRPARALLLALTACAAPPPEPPSVPPATTHAPEPWPVWVDGSIVASADGLFHDGLDAADATLIHRDAARHLRFDPATATLYYFAADRPVLRALTERTAPEARDVAELPPLDHPAFTSADPLAYLQRQEDLALDGATLCLDLHDRPDQPTATYNLRIDLATGLVERALVADLGGDNCGVEREAERPRLCTPAGPSSDGLRVPLPTRAVPMVPTDER